LLIFSQLLKKFQTSHNQPNRAKGAIMNQVQNTVKLDTLFASNPSIRQGLEQTASQLFFIPFMVPGKFAESIGLSEGVVGGWIDQGYIPTVKVGRYRMINMVVLVANLKEGKVL
jgi:hypothetical protein